MTSGIVVILCAMLINQAAAFELQQDGSLIAHPEPEDVLTKDEAITELNKTPLEEDREFPVSQVVVDYLYEMDQSDELFPGITVADLIEQNNFGSVSKGCSIDALKKRAAMSEEVLMAPTTNLGTYFAANVFVMQCLNLAVEYCLNHASEIPMAAELNGARIARLGEAYEQEGLGWSRDAQPPAKRAAEKIVEAKVMSFIQDRPESLKVVGYILLI